jgi:hypothetical protein
VIVIKIWVLGKFENLDPAALSPTIIALPDVNTAFIIATPNGRELTCLPKKR